MKVLCTGDIHIGRRSSRLPEHMDGRAHACAEAWGRVVEHALAERVDVVALSGDVVDRDNRYYEALGPLERGIRRLSESGIVTVAVAGNHDHDVFPRLADGLDGYRFRFLGRGGRWERLAIRRGGDVLHVVGWSFPGATMHESPLGGMAEVLGADRSGDRGVAQDDAPVLGLLHADLDQPGSPYAPVALAELRAAPVNFWLLGHVHAPRLHEADGAAPVLYPGSPQAMDPGESGMHGIWIVDFGPGRRFHARQLPLSSVRYDTIEVDVDGVAEPAEFDARVTGAVRAHLAAVGAEAGPLGCLSCRLRIVGRTRLHRSLESRATQLCADLELGDGGVSAVVERVELATRPARDLIELARGHDPVGVLARLLLALEDNGTSGGHERQDAPGAEHARLLREAVACMDEVDRARPYLNVAEEIDDDATRRATQALARQASLLLDELLAQKEDA